MFESGEGRIQGALLDVQNVTRHLPDAPRDCPAVQWFELQRFEDQKIERSLNEVDGLDGLPPMIIYTTLLDAVVDNQGEATVTANVSAVLNPSDCRSCSQNDSAQLGLMFADAPRAPDIARPHCTHLARPVPGRAFR
jgi:hypothetical protein